MFQTKPQIAIDLIDRALANGVRVAWWTCDELYGHDSQFLDALEARQQRFVAEIPCNTRVWTTKLQVITKDPRAGRHSPGRPPQTPRIAHCVTPSEVRQLLKHSPKFYLQSWQHYRIKETHQGPEVWQIKHLTVWRQTSEQLPSTRCTLIAAKNARTGELKFFLANGTVGEDGVTLRGLLRVAFSRWVIEAEFRVAKEELGLDHFEVRGWHCIHRHFYITGLSFLLCSRLRQAFDHKGTQQLTIEQVRRCLNTWLTYHDLPQPLREEKFQQELNHQRYYQRRNTQAIQSHTQTRIQLYLDLGIHVDNIKSCIQRL